MFVFGTRPEAIKLFPIIHALSDIDTMRVSVCVTAQHRELLDQVLEIAKVHADHDLDIMEPNQSLERLTARLLVGIGGVLDRTPVDRVIVQGDTTTAFAATLAASYHRIPVGHVEAGLRSGDNRNPWPEEVNRRLIAPIADLHFAATQTAAQALAAEGITRNVHVTGNTVIDALHATLAAIEEHPALVTPMNTLGEQIGDRRMILVTAHRRENLGIGMEQIATALARLAGRGDVAIVFPVHPNPGVTSVMDRMLSRQANVIRTRPLDYPNFVAALSMAHLVLTDSGGVQEEAPALGKPVLVMRDTTERPEGVLAGTARLIGTDAGRIVAAVTELLDDQAIYQAMARAHSPFGDGKAAIRIARLIAQAED